MILTLFILEINKTALIPLQGFDRYGVVFQIFDFGRGVVEKFCFIHNEGPHVIGFIW